MESDLQLNDRALVVLVFLGALDGFLAGQVTFLGESEISHELGVHLKRKLHNSQDEKIKSRFVNYANG